MIVICPECKSIYDVPGQTLGKTGRRVRCTSCGHIWFLQGLSDDKKPVKSQRLEEAALEPIPDSVRPLHTDHSLPPEQVSWAMRVKNSRYAPDFVGAVAVIAAALVLLCAGFPLGWAQSGPLQPLYASLAAPVPPYAAGLELKDIKAEEQIDLKGQRLLHISGSYFNAADNELPTMLLDIVIETKTGDELTRLTFKPEQTKINPGETQSFFIKIPATSIPAGAQVSLAFQDS